MMRSDNMCIMKCLFRFLDYVKRPILYMLESKDLLASLLQFSDLWKFEV